MHNIVFLGEKRVGELALKTLIKHEASIVCVITKNTSIAEIATQAKLPVYLDDSVNSEHFYNMLKPLEPDLGLVFSYPKILKKKFLDSFSIGCINFHPALLPNYRGCFPTVWPILNDDKAAFYTMHYIDEGIDTGDLIDSYKVTIDPNETGFSLYEKLVDVVPLLLERHLTAILTDRLNGVSQNHKCANYYPKKLPNDGQIDWQWGVKEVERFVRALYHPIFQGAYAKNGDKKLEILNVSIAEEPVGTSQYIPGTFIVRNEKIMVVCSDGYICINKIRDSFGEIISEHLENYLRTRGFIDN